MSGEPMSTDRTPQEHADAIKAAAQAYYDAVAAAENDGLRVILDSTAAVEVEARPQRWRAA